ncbi:MAG TPA: hypothetical protein PLF37_05280 [Planctomycetota bacterium]|nr:hypothetical protein [Planctomycetota bacterium]
MKDSLHFIIFGVLGFLGLVMTGVGVMVKSGAESDLTTAANKLQAAAKQSVPTAGDVKDIQARQARFVKDVEDFRTEWESKQGKELLRSEKTYATPDDFNNDASRTISALQMRFQALETEWPLPEILVNLGRRMQAEENEAARFWEQTASDMRRIQQQEIVMMQARLRVMSEVLVACECLKSMPEYASAPFSFKKFEFGSFNNEPQADDKEPWLRHEFQFVFNASPSLALAITNSLLVPSDATLASRSGKRDGLPLELVSLTGFQSQRAHDTGYEILAQERAKWEIPPDVTDEQWDNSKRAEVARKLESDTVYGVSMRFELKLSALRSNPRWVPGIKAEAAAAAQ